MVGQAKRDAKRERAAARLQATRRGHAAREQRRAEDTAATAVQPLRS